MVSGAVVPIVLIETLWNVKSASDDDILPFWKSINRNIVECKVFLTFSYFLRQFRINRNIVECKGVLDLYELSM